MDNDLNELDDDDVKPDPEPVETESPAETSFPETKRRNGMGTWKILQTVISAAFIVATLFTVWSPTSLVSKSLEERMSEALVAAEINTESQVNADITPDPLTAKRIGLVVGHQGNDSGAVCPDGLTEVEINSKIATYVQQRMIGLGYEVVLFDEFDERLNNFQGATLLSIHADSCDYINDMATGFKVAAALSASKFDNSTHLVNCISERYAQTTGMIFHYQSITNDMSYYHVFDEIDPQTTAAIIETGFMNLDKQMLTDKAELLAEGIVGGLLCYLNNEPIQQPQTTPTNP
jgi:N-acetylmuramoyl-L-alanine amidase